MLKQLIFQYLNFKGSFAFLNEISESIVFLRTCNKEKMQ